MCQHEDDFRPTSVQRLPSTKSDVQPWGKCDTFTTKFSSNDVLTNDPKFMTTNSGNIPNKFEHKISQSSWSPSLWAQGRAKTHASPYGFKSNFSSFENHEYLAKERADLQHAGVTPDPNSSNSRGSFWDDQGHQWIRFCYDTGCTGTVIPRS